MNPAYRFGTFEVQPAARRLLAKGGPVALGPRAFDVLLVLIERSGQLVSKDQLLESVWPGLVVEENNLQVQISNLRKVLGPAAIATIPGRGYRWTLAADDAPPPAAGAEQVASPALPQGVSDDAASPRPSELFGRSNDLIALCALAREHGLVTVVGPGGIGKTRLAQAAAHELRPHFVDGVRMVELASLADPALVALTVGRAMRVPVSDAATALHLVVQAAAHQRILLILDNCEHLLDAVDVVVAALRAGAPGVHILATTQELLRHADEHIYRLGTLGLPAATNAAQAKDAGAVQLFVTRVRALDARFELTEANVAAIVDICRQLDGIPLAIELAATRVPLLGVDGVRDKLDERFRLLTAGTRLALRRHQTLRAALEWSYGLLSEPQQSVLDRLGVFAGGFSLESAQQLACDDVIDVWDVLEHLGALVDKSMVIADGGDIPRYRMLETTRAFALERLAKRGETLGMLRRHAEVVLALFEHFYASNLAGAAPAEHVKRLSPELDNLRGAIHWASTRDGDSRIAVALVGACGAAHGFLWNSGLAWEGLQWCNAVRPLVDASIPLAHRARFALACAEIGSVVTTATAYEDAQRAAVLFREAHDDMGEFFAWEAQLYVLTAAGRVEEGTIAIREAERLLDPSWPMRLHAIHANQAGLYYDGCGALDEARAQLCVYRDISRRIGSESDELTALVLLADLDVLLGRASGAVESLREPIARGRVRMLDADDGLSLRNFAAALTEAGEFEEAEAIFREAIPPMRRNYGTGAFLLMDAALLRALQGQVDVAAKVAAYAETVYAARGRAPRAVALRSLTRVREMAANQRSPAALLSLEREGRALTDEQALALAFPS